MVSVPPYTPQTFDGDFKNITPNHLLSQNISHILSKICKIKNKPPLLIDFSKYIESKKGKITTEEVNEIHFPLYGNKIFSLISVLYFYKYDDIAQELLEIPGINKNEIDVFIGKLHFLIDKTPYKSYFYEYTKCFIVSQDINSIPIGLTDPLLHILVDLYLEKPSKVSQHLVLSFIEDILLEFPGFNINALDLNGYSMLDKLFYMQRDTSGDVGLIEEFLIENGAKYSSIHTKTVKENVDTYSQNISTILGYNGFHTSA